jgi:cytochrome oxidase Cu insertion factor (SCO1/SenC/PrrC family)
MNTTTVNNNRRALYIVLTIVLIFLIPIILAWWFYQQGGIYGEKAVNRGTLIQPPGDISKLVLQTESGKTYDQKQFHGHWLMLYTLPSSCDQNCQKMLYNMRQIRLATGTDMDRIQRVLLAFNNNPAEQQLQQLLQTKYKGTLYVVAQANQFQQIMPDPAMSKLALTQGYLYLVDPLGNIMMGYAMSTNPSDILKDLQRLLRVSQIG